MSNTKITKEALLEICNMIDEGFPKKTIAEKFKIDLSAIYRAKKRLERINERSKEFRTMKHPLYHRWRSMLRRCLWNSKHYEYYRGRGITVDPRWRNFKNFLSDMGMPDPLSLTLDRIDNSKGYYKENCRWATMQEQAQNRREKSRCRFGHEYVEGSFLPVTENGKTVKRCLACLASGKRKNQSFKKLLGEFA